MSGRTRKLRSNSRWWQFTEPELPSLLQPCAAHSAWG
jgi:hypothetical protein